MRWEPKPYALKGWAFEFDNDSVKAVPDVRELQDKISEAAERLRDEIAKAESTLMLRHLTDTALHRLAALCKEELKNRREMKKDFKL